MDFTATVTQRRCKRYIEAKAEELGIEFDLAESHVNSPHLQNLWNACLEFEANTDYTKEDMQKFCDALLYASKVSILQGVRHKEPVDIEVYQRLFNMAGPLDMCDTVYQAPKGRQLTIQWELTADDAAVTKLQPGFQFGLPFEEETKEALASN